MSIEIGKTDLINTINNQIKTNNANQITALVLNPVLLAIVEWVSASFGDGDSLGADDFVTAINDALGGSTTGITIQTGTDDPNDTPPGSFSLGDFYKRTSGASVIAWYQYNGIEWAQISGKEQEYRKGIRVISASSSIQDSDHTIIYQGVGAYTFDQEIASDHPQRILVFVNQAGSKNTLSQNYIGYDGLTTTDLPANSKVAIQSDGTNWYQI